MLRREQRCDSIAHMSETSFPWPHAPVHQLSESGTFFVTASTYNQEQHFRGAERLAILQRGLIKVTQKYGWRVEAWAVFSNHYHFVAHSPIEEETAASLSNISMELHSKLALWVNRLDDAKGRRVWYNFRETQLTYEKSYLARLNYVHQNAVKHGLVAVANQYDWFSGVV
ncbi:MAG: hypothetical protein SGI88_13165 [Candidatus Hydrogenedentes bacterium]|nr:hypothetical protein [Candidatus Hydrogenedentota bacterium]